MSDPFKPLHLICGARTGTCKLPVNHSGPCVDAEHDRLLKQARLDELQDIVILFGSPEFSSEHRQVYIKARVTELTAAARPGQQGGSK